MKLLVTDIGGTFIKYAVMDQDMNMLIRGKVPTPKESPQALVEALGQLYDRAGAKTEKGMTGNTDISDSDIGQDSAGFGGSGSGMDRVGFGGSGSGLAGIAICLPGIIDSDNGRVMMGGALRYNDGVALREMLYERIHAPIYMENDAKCAAMAEAAAGALSDVQDGLVIILGTMIGGGIIQGGKLWRGRHFSAGEVSYISTDRDSQPARDTVWGNRCSALALCRAYAKERGLAEEAVSGEMVFEAVAAGDEAAIACLDAYTKEVAVQLFNLQTILDPEKIAIGGGISAQPVLIEYIRKNLNAYHEQFPYPITRSEIVPCRFLNDANLYGAFQCFVSNMFAG